MKYSLLFEDGLSNLFNRAHVLCVCAFFFCPSISSGPVPPHVPQAQLSSRYLYILSIDGTSLPLKQPLKAQDPDLLRRRNLYKSDLSGINTNDSN